MNDSPNPTKPHCATAATRTAIIAGFGPVGRVVADMLTTAGVMVTVIETNPDTVYTQQQLGRRAVLGDARDPAVLSAARALAPHLFIAVRTNFVSRGLAAKTAGADAVIIEELVTARAMKDAVMEHFRACGVKCE